MSFRPGCHEHKRITYLGNKNGQIETDCDDPDGHISLMIAAQDGDAELVQQLMEEKAKLEATVFSSESMKQLMAAHHHQGIFNLILPPQGPAQMTAVESVRGRTPLTCAAEGGNMEVVRLLLENYNKDVSERDTEGGGRKSALHWAAKEGHEEVVEFLLQRGADVEMVDDYGQTPLFLAAYEGQIAAVNVLLKHNANVDVTDKGSRTPLVAVTATKAVEKLPRISPQKVMKRLIQQGSNIESKVGCNNMTPLLFTAYASRIDLMEQLLDCGADVEARDSDGMTALFPAAAFGNSKMVKLLLDHNAQADARDHKQAMPLDYALVPKNRQYNPFAGLERSNKRSTVELLLGNKPDLLLARGKSGWTAVGVAISFGDLEMVKLLLDKQNDIELVQNINCLPLLCFAAWQGQEAVIQILLERGASIQGIDGRHGRNALCWAATRGKEAAFQLLLQTPGMGWDNADYMGRTALFHATVRGHEDFFQQLRMQGSDVHRQDRFGLTPLFVAVLHGHKNLVQQILSHNPLAQEPRDRFGRSLSWWMQETGNTWMRDLLVGYGMQLGDAHDQLHYTFLREASVTCDVCTLSLSRQDRGVECGSGCAKYRICHACCQFGANMDFVEMEWHGGSAKSTPKRAKSAMAWIRIQWARIRSSCRLYMQDPQRRG